MNLSESRFVRQMLLPALPLMLAVAIIVAVVAIFGTGSDGHKAGKRKNPVSYAHTPIPPSSGVVSLTLLPASAPPHFPVLLKGSGWKAKGRLGVSLGKREYTITVGVGGQWSLTLPSNLKPGRYTVTACEKHCALQSSAILTIRKS